MADTDVTLGNQFLNSEGANTAVLSDTNMFPDTLLKANQQIWEEKKYAQQLHQKQIEDAAKALDFSTADMSNADQSDSQKAIDNFRQKYSTPDALKAFNGTDLNAALAMHQDRSKVNFLTDKGKADKLVYDKNVAAIQEHPNLYDDQSVQDLNNWYNQPLIARGNPPVLRTKPTFNPVTDLDNFTKNTPSVPITTGTINPDGSKTTITKNAVDPKRFENNVNTMFNNAVQNEGYLETVNRQKALALKGDANNPVIPVYDSNNLWQGKKELTPIGTTKLSDAKPFDVYMYDKSPVFRNYVSKDVTAPTNESEREQRYSDVQASVDNIHRLFFDNGLKGDYDPKVGGYALNTDYGTLAKSFTKKVPELDDSGDKVTNKDGAVVKKDDVPEIFIKNDKADPTKSRAVLVYSDGSKKEVAPEELITAELGSRGKSSRDYSAYMKSINGDGTATYNPKKYVENSGGNLPFQGKPNVSDLGNEGTQFPDINYGNPQPNNATQSVPEATADEWKNAGWTNDQIQQAVKLGKIKVK